MLETVAISDMDDMTPKQRAALPRLIRQAVVVAGHGLSHDGCPFCGHIVEHSADCIALVFGAEGRLVFKDEGPSTTGRV
jgi:hypothetical protein